MKNLYQCCCGKFSTSKPGLTLHQKACPVTAAQEAGKPTFEEFAVSKPEQPHPAAKELSELFNLLIEDIGSALATNNKSAARRARKRLLLLRKAILPIRKRLLEVLLAEAP